MCIAHEKIYHWNDSEICRLREWVGSPLVSLISQRTGYILFEVEFHSKEWNLTRMKFTLEKE